ncbi:MAG TPA: hypothetical protein VLT33_47100 [Labilithrix sp.]|nr:hypothetical protein [Labilithrix sp.]
MKRRTPVLAGAAALVGLLVLGCGGHAQRRTDWRRPPRPCTTDDECNGGKCVVAPEATQATCTGGALPPLPPADSTDAGPRAPGPAPSIQPSSSDIQI